MNDRPIHRVLGALRERECNPKAKGHGKWEACCPAHEDSDPSLSIGEGTDGRVLLHCFVGCKFDDIVEELGLKEKDLAPPTNDFKPSRKKPSAGSKESNGTSTKKPPTRSQGGNGRAYRTPEEALAWHVKEEGGKLSDQGPWPYNDAAGSELMQIYRIDKPGGAKAFRPVYRDIAGWHVGDPMPSGLPLYHLDELAPADTVYVCEGEKCADLVRRLGLTATTSSHGCGSASKTDWAPIAGKTAVLLPDFDPGGEKYINEAGAILAKLEPLPAVKVLMLPLKDKGDDIEQWLQGLPDTWGPDECKAELERLASSAPAWVVSVVSVASPPEEPPKFTEDPRPIATELLRVRGIDEAMIPAPLRKWLVDIAQRGCFPLEYPTAAAFVGLSGLIGRRIAIRPKRRDNWLVVPNLWGSIVGPPGIQKSPAVEEALRPLTRLAAAAIKEHEEKLREFLSGQLIADAMRGAAKKKLEAEAKKAAPSQVVMESLAQEALPGDDSIPPTAHRYLINDATLEKLGEILKENPNGVVVFRDELSGWLKSLDKQGHESDRGFYLEAWNGNGSYTWDRIGRGTVHIPNVCVSVFGTIQPGPLSRYLRASISGEEADGFIPRFQVLLYPDAPDRFIHVDRYPDIAAKNEAYKVFENLDKLNPVARGCQIDEERKIPYLNYSEEAQDFFDDWRITLENRLRSNTLSNAMTCHLAKYRSLLPSVALQLHLIDFHDQGELPLVSLDATRAAAAWCEVFESHARRTYQAASDGDPDDAIRLAQKIKESLPNPFTFSQVARKGWTGLSTVEEVRRAVGILEDRSWVKTVEVPSEDPLGRGRPSEKVWMHPKLVDGDRESKI